MLGLEQTAAAREAGVIDRTEDGTALWSARYGGMAPPAAGPWNATIAGLLSHRSVRAFRAGPVPAGTLETLVAAAQSAATSSNLQTWSVIAVGDRARRSRLARIAGNQRQVEQCPLFLAWIADLSRLDRVGQAEGRAMEGLPYTESLMLAVIDAALAAQNAVVAAESLGLSTVYIGALRNDPEATARELGLPPRAVAVFGLCVGYAAPGAEGEIKPRLPQSAILHHERYDASGDAAMRPRYDTVLAEFSARNGMGNQGWTERVLARIGMLAGMSGREKMRAALAVLGFPLR